VRVALVNPSWSFDGSIYFGCREPHLPLEYGYAAALLRARGHEVLLVDGQLRGLSPRALKDEVEAFEPTMIVVTTAPSYLFWRCPPPELRVPREVCRIFRESSAILVAVGPHASTTPRATLRKLGVHAVVLGECEEVLAELADAPRGQWEGIASIAYPRDGEARVQGAPRATDMKALAALAWSDATIALHRHHHHRFDAAPESPGAEIEASRGCPYACTFCAKDNFRDQWRSRPLATVLDELDRLIAQGVGYVYFIDEIFTPSRPLLEALAERDVAFGAQMRIDQWSPAMLDLLGEAGCVSIEAGVESVTPEGRSLLAKRCKLSTDELADRLVHVKQRVPFVQANLLDSHTDEPAAVRRFRELLQRRGVWSNEPVPMFHYPGSPGYSQRWGAPDEAAWERAVNDYLQRNSRFSDIQESRPLPIEALEEPSHG
jgi:B12-binding domain/radical SAM domain protein of rhizo-twelve system